MKVLSVIFIVMLGSLQIRLWVGGGSLSDVFRMNSAVAAQLDENQYLLTRNRTLEAEVTDLKTGDAAIEERARSELGMIGEDETFFQIVDIENAPLDSNQQSTFLPAASLKKASHKRIIRTKRPEKICDSKDKCILPGFGR